MSVGLILDLLNELNKSITLFNTYNNLVMNLHEFNILFIIYSKNELLIVKKDHFEPTRL